MRLVFLILLISLQVEAMCEPDTVVDDLTTDVMKIVAKTSPALQPSGFGFKVDPNCYRKWGPELKSTIKSAYEIGFQCLADLDRRGSTPEQQSAAGEIADSLKKLMKNDGISLVCSEDPYPHKDTLGKGSTALDDEVSGMKIPYPFVSLNPAHPRSKKAERSEEMEDLKDTLFHESLHTLGYRHGFEIEAPYTCGLCCFDKEAKKNLKDVACRICTGNYSDQNDLAYLKDIATFSQLNQEPQIGTVAIVNFMKETPKNLPALAYLSLANSGYSNPIGPELARYVLDQHKNVSPDDLKILTEALKRTDGDDLKMAPASAKILPKAIYELYYNASGAAAMSLLVKNKIAMKAELEALAKDEKNTGLYENLSGTLKRMIFEEHRNDNPDEDAKGDAGSLFKYFNDHLK